MELNEDGYADRPDELVGQDITILGRVEVETKDGRTGEQWVVRKADGRKRLFWAAGNGPTQQVRYWFMEYPNTPLHARLTRRFDVRGNNVWFIEQRELGRSEAEVERDAGLQQQLDEAGI